MSMAQPTDPTEPIGVGIIGAGYWGRNYVRVIHELPGTTVSVVCDASPMRLQAVGIDFPYTQLMTSLDEALAVPGLSAVVVCTPASTHEAITSQCLAAGMHVLVEKPLTTSSADAAALVYAAEERGLALVTGHTFLFNEGVRRMRDSVLAGELGRLYYLHARRSSLGPIRNDVNAMWDLAPHDISIFNFVLGATPQRVSAVGGAWLSEERADVGFITLRYPDDVVAHVHVSWLEPSKTREVVIVGSEKRIVFNDTDNLERIRIFEKGIAPAPAEASTFGEFNFLLRDGDIISPVLPVSEPLKEQCAHFLRVTRGIEQPVSDGRFGWDVVRVMEAIDRSAAMHGAPVRVDEESGPHAGGLPEVERAPSSVR